MTGKRVMVIEDDEAIRGAIVCALEHEGYEWLEAARGDEGMLAAVEGEFDLLLLDVMLPGADGFDVLQRVRECRPTLPVVMLTARGEEADRVRGLRLGADDYVVKPFSKAELMARIEAVLRRSAERPSDVAAVKLAGGSADLERRVVVFDDGARVPLTEREVELLRFLAQRPGRIVSREELMAGVWRLDPRGVNGSRTIDMQIARLREKLRDPPVGGRIRTVRGKGYIFETGAGASADGDG